jgi:hypothetical protein
MQECKRRSRSANRGEDGAKTSLRGKKHRLNAHASRETGQPPAAMNRQLRDPCAHTLVAASGWRAWHPRMGCSRSLELWPCLTAEHAQPSTKDSELSTIMHDQVSFAMLHRLSALSSGDKSMFSSGTLSTLSANQKSTRAAGQKYVECNSRIGDTEVRNCPLWALQAAARPSERRAVLTSTAKGVVAELTRCIKARFRCKGLKRFTWLSRRRC